MKIRTLFVCVLVSAIAFAASSSYRVTLIQPSMLHGTELKPGDYKVEVKDSTATVRKGKTSVEAPVRIESSSTKFPSTSVTYGTADGKMTIQEIRIGGTNTRLIFE